MTISTDGSTPVSEQPVDRVKDIEKPEPDLYDPFAPENLKLPQEFLDQTMATTLMTTIPVEKPGDQEFIRVHPDEAYRHLAILITHQDERGARYFVHPTFAPKLGNIKYHPEQLTSTRVAKANSLFGRSSSRKTIGKTLGWNRLWLLLKRP